MVVEHEVLSVLGEALLNLRRGVGETDEDGGDIGAGLHGDDTHLILFVNPSEEVLGLVVEDTTGVGPVAAASGGEEQGGVGLLEEVSAAAEVFLLFVGHAVGVLAFRVGAEKSEDARLVAVEGQVLTGELAFHRKETFDAVSFDLTALDEGVGGREAGAADGAAGTAASGQGVLAGGIDGGGGEVGGVHVTDVLGISGVAVVAARDDGIES